MMYIFLLVVIALLAVTVISKESEVNYLEFLLMDEKFETKLLRDQLIETEKEMMK